MDFAAHSDQHSRVQPQEQVTRQRSSGAVLTAAWAGPVDETVGAAVGGSAWGWVVRESGSRPNPPLELLGTVLQ